VLDAIDRAAKEGAFSPRGATGEGVGGFFVTPAIVADLDRFIRSHRKRSSGRSSASSRS